MSINNVCRLCLSTDNLMWIFDDMNEHENMKMKDIVYFSTGIEVHIKDVISQHICNNCSQFTFKMFQFRNQCMKSEKYLKEQSKKYLKNRKSNISNTQVTIKNESKQIPCKPSKPSFCIHPSVTHIAKAYPDLKLPVLCLKSHIAPVVEMEMDEVESYFKKQNLDINVYIRSALMSTKKNNRLERLQERNANANEEIQIETDQLQNSLNIKCNKRSSVVKSVNVKPDLKKDGNMKTRRTIEIKRLIRKRQINNSSLVKSKKDGMVAKTKRPIVSNTVKQCLKGDSNTNENKKSSAKLPLTKERQSPASSKFNRKRKLSTDVIRRSTKRSRCEELLDTTSRSAECSLNINDLSKVQGTSDRKRLLNLIPKETTLFLSGNNSSDSLSIIDKSVPLHICNICNSVQYTAKYLRKHRIEHLRCQFCKIRFRTLSAKIRHIENLCIIKKSMTNMPNVIIEKIENDLETRRKYPDAFVNFPPIETENIIDLTSVSDRDVDLLKYDITNKFKTILNNLMLSSTGYLNITHPKETIKGVDNMPSDHLDVIEIVSDEDEMSNMSSKNYTKDCILIESTNQVSVCQANVQNRPLSPKITVKNSCLLNNMDLRDSDTNLIKRLLTLSQPKCGTNQTHTQTHLPTNKDIILEKDIVLKDIKQQMWAYKVPVIMRLGKLNVSYDYNTNPEHHRKLCFWNDLTPIDIKETEVERYCTKSADSLDTCPSYTNLSSHNQNSTESTMESSLQPQGDAKTTSVEQENASPILNLFSENTTLDKEVISIPDTSLSINEYCTDSTMKGSLQPQGDAQTSSVEEINGSPILNSISENANLENEASIPDTLLSINENSAESTMESSLPPQGDARISSVKQENASPILNLFSKNTTLDEEVSIPDTSLSISEHCTDSTMKGSLKPQGDAQTSSVEEINTSFILNSFSKNANLENEASIPDTLLSINENSAASTMESSLPPQGNARISSVEQENASPILNLFSENTILDKEISIPDTSLSINEHCTDSTTKGSLKPQGDAQISSVEEINASPILNSFSENTNLDNEASTPDTLLSINENSATSTMESNLPPQGDARTSSVEQENASPILNLFSENTTLDKEVSIPDTSLSINEHCTDLTMKGSLQPQGDAQTSSVEEINASPILNSFSENTNIDNEASIPDTLLSINENSAESTVESSLQPQGDAKTSSIEQGNVSPILNLFSENTTLDKEVSISDTLLTRNENSTDLLIKDSLQPQGDAKTSSVEEINVTPILNSLSENVNLENKASIPDALLSIDENAAESTMESNLQPQGGAKTSSENINLDKEVSIPDMSLNINENSTDSTMKGSLQPQDDTKTPVEHTNASSIPNLFSENTNLDNEADIPDMSLSINEKSTDLTMIGRLQPYADAKTSSIKQVNASSILNSENSSSENTHLDHGGSIPDMSLSINEHSTQSTMKGSLLPQSDARTSPVEETNASHIPNLFSENSNLDNEVSIPDMPLSINENSTEKTMISSLQPQGVTRISSAEEKDASPILNLFPEISTLDSIPDTSLSINENFTESTINDSLLAQGDENTSSVEQTDTSPIANLFLENTNLDNETDIPTNEEIQVNYVELI